MTSFSCQSWLPPSEQTMSALPHVRFLKLPTLHKSCHDSYKPSRLGSALHHGSYVGQCNVPCGKTGETLRSWNSVCP